MLATMESFKRKEQSIDCSFSIIVFVCLSFLYYRCLNFTKGKFLKMEVIINFVIIALTLGIVFVLAKVLFKLAKKVIRFVWESFKWCGVLALFIVACMSGVVFLCVLVGIGAVVYYVLLFKHHSKREGVK